MNHSIIAQIIIKMSTVHSIEADDSCLYIIPIWVLNLSIVIIKLLGSYTICYCQRNHQSILPKSTKWRTPRGWAHYLHNVALFTRYRCIHTIHRTYFMLTILSIHVFITLLYNGDCSLVRRFCSPKVRKSEIKGSSFRRSCSPKVRKSDNDFYSFLL